MESEYSGLPKDVQTGLGQMAEALGAAKIAHALIGGIAVGFHSRPRFTNDIDFLLNVPQLKLAALLDDLRVRGFDFDMAKTIEEWTRQHLTVVDFHEVRIDWLKPVLPLYQHVIDTAKPISWNGCTLSIASPESLILTKLIAFRGQDQIDIEGLLAANRGLLDFDYIRSEWATIAPVEDRRMQRFLEMAGKSD